jgi:hypothetical protein
VLARMVVSVHRQVHNGPAERGDRVTDLAGERRLTRSSDAIDRNSGWVTQVSTADDGRDLTDRHRAI